MDTNKMREQFEAAYTAYCERLGWKTYTAFHMLSEVYVKESTELAWQMWRASREAVVVDLPARKGNQLEGTALTKRWQSAGRPLRPRA